MPRKSKELKRRMRNKKLCKKYPWLIPWKCWHGNREVYGWYKGRKYEYIMWDFWPRGWNKVLGPQLLKELGEAVDRSGFKNDFHVVDGKEKWGRMILDCGPVNDEIMDILSKYEDISQNVCISCGKPAPMINQGWLSPECYDCFKKFWRYREKYFKKELAPEEEIMEAYNEAKNRCTNN